MELTITTVSQAKQAARTLRGALADAHIEIPHARALEIVSRQLGFQNWNAAAAELPEADSAGIGSAVPVLRIQDETLARRFYVDYLGFEACWEHRFDEGLPLYLRLARGAAVLDLSGHHGDGTPGTVVWLPVADVQKLHGEVTSNGSQPLRPGIEQDAPGGPTMTVTDPFGNVLRFCETTEVL